MTGVGRRPSSRNSGLFNSMFAGDRISAPQAKLISHGKGVTCTTPARQAVQRYTRAARGSSSVPEPEEDDEDSESEDQSSDPLSKWSWGWARLSFTFVPRFLVVFLHLPFQPGGEP